MFAGGTMSTAPITAGPSGVTCDTQKFHAAVFKANVTLHSNRLGYGGIGQLRGSDPL
jgi:hypothetical protein